MFEIATNQMAIGYNTQWPVVCVCQVSIFPKQYGESVTKIKYFEINDYKNYHWNVWFLADILKNSS